MVLQLLAKLCLSAIYQSACSMHAQMLNIIVVLNYWINSNMTSLYSQTIENQFDNSKMSFALTEKFVSQLELVIMATTQLSTHGNQ